MIASLSSAAVVRDVASTTNFPKANRQIGELEVRFRRNEPLFLGNEAGSFSSIEDALSGAAGLSQQHGGVFAVTESKGAFLAEEVVQPVWTKRFAREDSFGNDRAQVELLRAGDKPEFGFFKYRTDEYGRSDKRHTGGLKLDAAAGVTAIVGSDWALMGDGRVREVQAVRPTPPIDPNPPVDPKPPVDPTDPVNPGGPSRTLVEDVTEAARLATEAYRIVNQVPRTDQGDESTKDVRIKAYKTNMAAQARLERQFQGNSPDVLSVLRTADASLEDANWQLAKKPSPDGRFNGVDIDGALRDTQRAVSLLDGLLEKLVPGRPGNGGGADPVNPPAAA